MSIALDQARAIIAAALAAGHEAGMKPLAVLVLDAGGHVTAFEREDGASNGRFEIAQGKAKGALSMGLNGGEIEQLAERRPHFVAALNGTFAGGLIPVEGGVIVLDTEGTVVGAVGISGDASHNDEIAARAGIAACGLVARESGAK